MLKGIVIGIILGVIVLAGGAYYYFASGMAPVATADSMMPFERKMVSMARDAHIEKQHVGESPVAADEPNLLAGADGSRLGMAAKSSNVKQFLASISFARELGACVDSAELCAESLWQQTLSYFPCCWSLRFRKLTISPSPGTCRAGTRNNFSTSPWVLPQMSSLTPTPMQVARMLPAQ
jgi:hypothetical protein